MNRHPQHSHLLEGLDTLSPADLSAPTPGSEGRVLARHGGVEEAREHLPSDNWSLGSGWGIPRMKGDISAAKWQGTISSTWSSPMHCAQCICWDQSNGMYHVSTSCRSLVKAMHSVVPCEPHRGLPQCASAYANARALRHVQLRTLRSTWRSSPSKGNGKDRKFTIKLSKIAICYTCFIFFDMCFF